MHRTQNIDVAYKYCSSPIIAPLIDKNVGKNKLHLLHTNQTRSAQNPNHVRKNQKSMYLAEATYTKQS